MAVCDFSAGEAVIRDHLPEELPPAPTLEELRAMALQRLADIRWTRCQTFQYDGVATAADPAMAPATAAMVSSQFLPEGATITWKLGAAEFRTWTVAQLVAFGMAIRDHIQGCFNREATLTAEILASEAPGEVDLTGGWPG